MKTVLVARDAAPSFALERLGDYLVKQGEDKMLCFVGKGRPLKFDLETVAHAVSVADVLVVGMSSSAELAEPELKAAKWAKERGVPVAFYADTFNGHNRHEFPNLLPGETLFHISEEEAKKARERFPKTDVVVSGNPMWDTFFFPKYTREEVRQKLEIPADVKVILSPQGKSAAVNVLLVGNLIEALVKTECRLEKVEVLLSLHPGDETNPKVYEDLVRLARPVKMRIVPRDQMTASDILPGVDLLFESASTLGIEAACQRKPVIDFFTHVAMNRLEDTGGSREWELCNQGAATKITDQRGLSMLSHFVEGIDLGQCTRSSQEKFYPEPKEPGEALRIMGQTITKLASLKT